jgi:hypothetical protein
MVCLVNFLYNGKAEGSSNDLVTVSKYAKELQIKGLVNSGHKTQPFQLELLEKKKVEEQLQKLQSHEYDSDSNSSEDEDLQIIYESVQESLPLKRDETNELVTKNTSLSEINSKRKRNSSQCSVFTPTEKKIILEPTPPGTITYYYFVTYFINLCIRYGRIIQPSIRYSGKNYQVLYLQRNI